MISGLLARCSFPAPGTPVTCAVSGGPDSLALLVLATEAGCQVTAVHVDHGLRPGSAAEADVVRDAAARYGAAFRGERVDVAPGPNLEARARAARYAVLPPDVLTGHTADDQAETVLLNLIRGAGLDGLAGMRSGPGSRSGGRSGPISRSGGRSGPGHPILALRRAETEKLCADEGLAPVVDPTNADPVHRRNRVRHELLPLLDDIAARDVASILARQAALLRDDAAALDTIAAGLDPTDARAVAAAAPAVARRSLRAWLADAHPPDAATVERVLAVARNEAKAADVGGGRRVARTGNVLRLEG